MVYVVLDYVIERGAAYELRLTLNGLAVDASTKFNKGARTPGNNIPINNASNTIFISKPVTEMACSN